MLQIVFGFTSFGQYRKEIHRSVDRIRGRRAYPQTGEDLMLNRLFSWRATGQLLDGLCILGLSSASAQSGDAENGELTAFGAVASGAGTRPAFGASAGAAFSRYGMGLFE